jgi:hypothetical protein
MASTRPQGATAAIRGRRPYPLVWVVAFTFLTAACVIPLRATSSTSLLSRFFSRSDEPLHSYRAYRMLHAVSDRFDKEAWLDAWTELHDGHFSYQVVSERGTSMVSDRVLKAMLEKEEKLVNSGDRGLAELNDENYEFVDAGQADDGSPVVELKPRRHDVMLVDGRMVLTPDGRDLVRVEGRLSKNPSFWTTLVNVVEHFRRISGVRVPVATESVAKIRFAGTSHLDERYEYQSINGRAVSKAENRAPAQVSVDGR